MKHRTLSLKPDYDESAARYESFWARDGSERPPVCITFPREGYVWPKIDTPAYATQKERWTDVGTRAMQSAAYAESLEYYADAMPVVWPNLGPEVFSAWCGCGYDFTADTGWSVPCIDFETGEGEEKTRLDTNNAYFRLTEEYTDRLLEYGRGKFIVGLTDIHPGGDHAAALLGPDNLAMALIENPELVKRLVRAGTDDYFSAYRHFADRLIAEDMPLTSWTPLISDEYYYIPSCDFSCMVSGDMFREFFLPAIEEECSFMKHTIYHLDGPNALRHLDDILAIDALDAVQWVPIAGKEDLDQTLAIYRRVQAAGKGVQLNCSVNDLDKVFSSLRPEGMWFSYLGGIENKAHADAVLARIERWK